MGMGWFFHDSDKISSFPTRRASKMNEDEWIHLRVEFKSSGHGWSMSEIWMTYKRHMNEVVDSWQMEMADDSCNGCFRWLVLGMAPWLYMKYALPYGTRNQVKPSGGWSEPSTERVFHNQHDAHIIGMDLGTKPWIIYSTHSDGQELIARGWTCHDIVQSLDLWLWKWETAARSAAISFSWASWYCPRSMLSSFTACHPGNARAKVNNPTSNWMAKKWSYTSYSTGGLSNGQLRIHTSPGQSWPATQKNQNSFSWSNKSKNHWCSKVPLGWRPVSQEVCAAGFTKNRQLCLPWGNVSWY